MYSMLNGIGPNTFLPLVAPNPGLGTAIAAELAAKVVTKDLRFMLLLEYFSYF
jgi:hypothetical protein